MSEEENEIKEAQDKATQDPTATEDAPTEEEATDDVEDDSDFIEEEAPEEDTDAEEETDETDEEEAGDEETDYDKLAEDEYGSDEEEDKEKNEDDDIPTGESYFSFGEDGAGVLKSIKNTVKSITGSIAKYWHDISEKARIANEKAKQPRSYSTISPEEKEVQRQKSLDSFNEWFNKYISEMTPYLNSKNEDTCWGSYELVRKFLDEIYYDPATALTYGYAYNDVLDIVHDEITTVNKNFVKHMKDTFDVDLSDQVADKTSGSGESHMFRRKYGHTTIDPQAFSEMINTLLETERDTLKTFAESRGLSFVANSTDYAITSKTLINTTAVVLAARYKFGFYN
jgi:hypothetical protein